MNGYELSRVWFNYCFDNPEKVKPINAAIFFFAIEHCNRLGWKEKFGFPSQMVMEAIGVKNWRTYSKALNELVEWGFIKMIETSRNQYSSNIIAIVKNTKAPTKALDKALSNHYTKQVQSTVSIDKQLNKEQLNKEQKDATALLIKECVDLDKKELFDKWVQYRKEIKKQIKSIVTLQSLIKKINSEPLDKCELVINASIENQWVGLFWDKVKGDKKQNTLDNAAINAAETIRLINEDPNY